MARITQGKTYHPCRHCHTPTLNLNHYCDKCKEYAYKSNWNNWHKQNKSQRRMLTDSSQWRRLREYVKRRDDYLCQECLRNGYITSGTEVDHIVPVSQGGNESLDNLQLLCHECHKEKTLRESKHLTY